MVIKIKLGGIQKMRKLLLLIVGLLFMSIITACGNESGKVTSETTSDSTSGEDNVDKVESVEWLANSVWAEDNYITENMNEFNDIVAVNTNGQVEINVNSGGALGFEGGELLKAVRDNLVNVSDFVANAVSADEKLYGIATLPFLFNNFEEAELFNEIARPYYDKVAEEKWNQRILYVNPWPGQGFWTKEKIQSIEDLNNKKMRVVDENGANVIQTVGATPYQLPFSEVYSSLSTGVIDSVMTSPPSGVDGKFWEVLDYYIPTNVTMGVGFVTVNLDEFNKLDAETQQAVVDAGKEMDEVMWGRVDQINEEMISTVEENGIEIIQPTDELMSELARLTEGHRAEWLEDAPEEAKEILDAFYEEVGR